MSVRVTTCVGPAVTPHRDDLARLRIAVFRDWPYLYEGDLDHERRYLAAYANSPRSVFVLALDGDAVIGASSGIPLGDDGEAFQAPFRTRGMAVDEVCYFGESVLLRDYRGQGIGHTFFDEREAHARRLGGFAWTAFCALERDADDPRCPPAYRPNDAFWAKRGYRRQDDLFCTLWWTEPDAASERRRKNRPPTASVAKRPCRRRAAGKSGSLGSPNSPDLPPTHLVTNAWRRSRYGARIFSASECAHRLRFWLRPLDA